MSSKDPLSHFYTTESASRTQDIETDPDLDDIDQLDEAMESSLDQMQRGLGLYAAIQDVMEAHSFEGALSSETAVQHYRASISNLITAAGLQGFDGLAASFEADDEQGEKKPADTKGVLDRIVDWLKRMQEAFTKWLEQRNIKLIGLKNKVDTEAATNETALKAA